MKKYVIDFNNLKSKESKCYYVLTILGVVVFCIINTYLNPNMNNAPIYKEFILVYSLFSESISAVVESLLLSIVIKMSLPKSNLKNVFIGLFVSMLLLNCIFGILSLIALIVKGNYIINLNYIIMLLNAFLKCFVYSLSIEKSFGTNNIKAKSIGIILIVVEYLVVIFMK